MLLFGLAIPIVNLQAKTISKFGENSQVITEGTVVKNNIFPYLDSSNSNCNQFLKEKSDTLWTPEDEGDHFPCGGEYWWLYTMLTLEDGSHWDMCCKFIYTMNWTGKQWSETNGRCELRIQVFNRETGKCFDSIHAIDHPGVFQHKKNMVDLKFYNSTMKGLYPNYTAFFDDDINNIQLTVDFNAVAPPCWHLQESVNGTIPIGTGTLRYGSLPFVEVKGNLSINGTVLNVTGIGYYEHLFGDSFVAQSIRFTSLKDLLKVGSLYSSIAKWLLSERIKNGLKKTHFLHMDNLRGTDWIWVAFDNGWSVMFERLRFGVFAEGPCVGNLILSDGKESWEFADVYIKINRETYLQESDLYVPLDFEIRGFKDNKSIFIVFNTTTNITKKYGMARAFEGGLFLAAGEAAGYFKEGETTISLCGQGLNNPCLFTPKTKYRSLEIELLLPPYGFGISIRKISHPLGIEIFFKLQLRPTFEFIFYIKPAPET